jgi:hypothetical protein
VVDVVGRRRRGGGRGRKRTGEEGPEIVYSGGMIAGVALLSTF